MIAIQRQRYIRREISLIPLINIIFLLLIFFMVAGQVQRMETLKVSPPQSEQGKERRYLPIILYLDDAGAIAINGDIIKREDMQLLLKTALENLQSELAVVTIRADKNAKATELVWLMEAAKKAGAGEVSIITQNGEQG